MVYVFTRTPSENYQNIHFINSDIPDLVRKLKTQKGKDIWLLGGSEIITLLQNENLIDEYVISVHPVIVGEGIPLFKDIRKPAGLTLVSCKDFNSGLVQFKYTIR